MKLRITSPVLSGLVNVNSAILDTGMRVDVDQETTEPS